jgi:FkbM family methyltransferase
MRTPSPASRCSRVVLPLLLVTLLWYYYFSSLQTSLSVPIKSQDDGQSSSSINPLRMNASSFEYWKTFFIEHVRKVNGENDGLGFCCVEFEPGLFGSLARHSPRPEHRYLSIDIGANLGQSSLWMSGIPPYSTVIYAFEPSPKNFEVLKTVGQSIQRAFHWELNRWYGFQIALTSPALVPKSGKMMFYNSDEVNSQQGTLSTKPDIRSGNGPGFEVEVTTLDDFFEKQLTNGDSHATAHVLLLKIDTEGFDGHVLLGATQTLKRTQAVLFEYHWKWKDAEPVIELYETQLLLESLDFSCFLVSPSHLIPITGMWWDLSYEIYNWANVVCFRRCSTMLRRAQRGYNDNVFDTSTIECAEVT